MSRSKIAVFAFVALFSLLGVGCGHRHADVVVTTSSGNYQPFTLTLQNNTNQTLLPGPVEAQPYDPNVPAVQIPPGGTATYSIGFLPSSIRVGATGVGAFANYVYPTQTLYLGIDYFSDATGVTFIYR